MTIKQALDSARQQLKAAGVISPDLDSLVLAELAFGKDRANLLAHPENEISQIQQSEFEVMIAERVNRKPIAHITNEKEFYGIKFKVSSGVLAPRPESEKIVEYAINYAPKNSSLLDVGTGSGALAIAIAKNRPDLKVTATELSEPAIQIAKQNIQIHKVADRVTLLPSDLFEQLHTSYLERTGSLADRLSASFGTVVANLPYLKDDEELEPEVQQEPQVALLGGPDGLNLYRKFFDQLPTHLEKPGYVFIESDPWQQPDLIKIAQKAGLKVIEQDYFVLGFKAA